MSNQYKIGQVLYIISPKTTSVIPVQIQEINQKTTIEGEETIYMVMDPGGRGPHNLDSISGRIYINSSDAAKFLKENISKTIDSIVSDAQKLAKEKFGNIGGDTDIFITKKKIEEPSIQKKQQQMISPSSNQKEIEKGEIEEVVVIGKDGSSKMQRTKIRSIQMPGEEPVVAN